MRWKVGLQAEKMRSLIPLIQFASRVTQNKQAKNIDNYRYVPRNINRTGKFRFA